MRYQVLATDYDGTLATHGHVEEPTVAALQRFLATGRRLVLVTGRELPELIGIFPQISLFEWVVAENGGLLYHPSTRKEKSLGAHPSEKFLNLLNERNVKPISVGRVIVATWEPHEKVVLDTIHDLGLEMQVIFNKGAVMVLPAGINKATGLTAALKEMSLSPHNVVGVGDAENDHALLRMCEFSAAVANALPAVKETADMATTADHGAGVVELIEEMIANDLSQRAGRLERHFLPLGNAGRQEVKLTPYGPNVLLAGPSASGKSTVATGFVETLAAKGYQFCIIDPEGDYENFDGAVVLGGPQRAPVAAEVLQLLGKPEDNAVVSLTGMKIADRPPFFLELLSQLLQMRARTGRPHWLILDEAHHLLPADWKPPAGLLPEQLRSVMFITVHPDLLAGPILERVDTVFAVGQDAASTLRRFAGESANLPAELTASPLGPGEYLLWTRVESQRTLRVRANPSRMERKRHRRKYSEGELPPERSFYFRGPEGKLKLRAQNLMLFLQMADGVDDATWEHHLKNGDYSKWFREGIKDEALAAETQRIEAMNVSPEESRGLMRSAVERDYTLPATPPLPVAGAS